jgi:hypothetical protein
MSKDSQQAITHVLQQDSLEFNAFLNKIKQLNQLQLIFNKCINAKTAQFYQVASLEKGLLTILTESANWATQLRFQVGDLLGALRQHPELYHLKNISCIVRPSKRKQLNEPPLQAVSKLSSFSAEVILDAAKTIQHTKLKAILEKIAKHTTA